MSTRYERHQRYTGRKKDKKAAIRQASLGCPLPTYNDVEYSSLPVWFEDYQCACLVIMSLSPSDGRRIGEWRTLWEINLRGNQGWRSSSTKKRRIKAIILRVALVRMFCLKSDLPFPRSLLTTIGLRNFSERVALTSLTDSFFSFQLPKIGDRIKAKRGLRFAR